MKKQLWRRWRRWKKAPWVGAACIVLTVLAWRGMQVPEEISLLLNHTAWTLPGTISDKVESGSSLPAVAAVYNDMEADREPEAAILDSQELLKAVNGEPVSRTVHLKTVYVSGEEVQTLPGKRTPAQLKLLIARYAGWSGWFGREGDLWLEQRVEDLSPLTKKEAYFGVDEQGNLTLFKGRPESEKVMKTFFQLDMGSMKSSLPADIWEQLHQGIRVQDMEEYNSVLSTFSDYARDSAEQVMQAE
ncbi:BofC C-terminal domain-containing protein [Paenibacillus sp. MMS20-IR301]|uniref:BofC C-terminal domain-containing protein n=1 Tax=Paenibacillus sp. MMS20-IR301 TaxID=2895946 RepID=UPI0028E34700|nr:BofC C-terminal domain-containing protein [Paenibacillus sp. MMS20-IR301]WNS43640.1 BofC C-terminal domain-containing protein [Paenibacillus sp. MMS20-IR301]